MSLSVIDCDSGLTDCDSGLDAFIVFNPPLVVGERVFPPFSNWFLRYELGTKSLAAMALKLHNCISVGGWVGYDWGVRYEELSDAESERDTPSVNRAVNEAVVMVSGDGNNERR